MPDATFACPDLTTFCRLDELGLEVTGQRLDAGRAVLACRITDEDRWCRRCGEQGSPRDTCKPHDVLAAIAAYRDDKDWRGAVFVLGAVWAGFQAHAAAVEARNRLDGLIDTSEDRLDASDDPGDEDSPADMPTK